MERIAVRGPRIGDAWMLRRREGLAVNPPGYPIHAEEQRHGHRHPRDPDHEDDEPPSHDGFDPSRTRRPAEAQEFAIGLPLPQSR